ncbi:MAG: hypothetical protein HQK53_17075 [Oligoflexia bacterium]|nr:hypothetical protein [Oligoflexia bacterium]
MLQLQLNRIVNFAVWLLIVSFFLIKFACASILFEPYLGYSLMGRIEKKMDENGPSHRWKYFSPGLGARVGFDYSGIFMGGELGVMLQEWNGMEPITSGVNDTTQEITMNYLGFFLGYFTTAGVSFRATYVIQSSFKKGDDNGPYSKDDAYHGMGYALAIGYRVISLLAVNLEFRSFFLNSIDVDAEKTTHDLDHDRGVSVNEVFLSFSTPLIL